MRVIAGPEKKARLLSEQERKITAYHEMGHALVGHFLENTNPVHKITIVSRGQAFGLTISLPTEDKYLQTRSALMDDLAMTLGGRAAEELVFHEVTTGAANDLEKVTHTAKQMIMRFGMSEKLGPRVLGRNHDMPFLGREMGHEPDYSDEIAREIDCRDPPRDRRGPRACAQHPARVTSRSCTRFSAILIRARDDRTADQFDALPAGRSEDEVFPPEPGAAGASGGRCCERRPQPEAAAFPFAWAAAADAASARARGRLAACRPGVEIGRSGGTRNGMRRLCAAVLVVAGGRRTVGRPDPARLPCS
jgi:cell division protease FtsH